jgi:hypothetical protein
VSRSPIPPCPVVVSAYKIPRTFAKLLRLGKIQRLAMVVLQIDRLVIKGLGLEQFQQQFRAIVSSCAAASPTD